MFEIVTKLTLGPGGPLFPEMPASPCAPFGPGKPLDPLAPVGPSIPWKCVLKSKLREHYNKNEIQNELTCTAKSI